MQEKRTRPVGVTIIAVLLIIAGIFELAIGGIAIAAIFSAGQAVTTHGHSTIGGIIDAVGGVLGGISIVVGIITLIFAWGLWALKRWAFWLTVILEGFSLLRHIYEFIQPHTHIALIIAGTIIPVVILLYFLVDPHVRRAFRI
jgi:hypothetical protein